MKIAVNTRSLLPNRLESTGRFIHEILHRLTVKYPEHEFYFFFDRAYDPKFIYSVNVKPVVLYPSVRHPFLYYWWYQVSLARALKKLQPDVFLSMDGITTLNTSVPRVTVMHDLAYVHFPQEIDYISRKYFKYYSQRFARVSDKVISPSEFIRQDINKLYSISLNKIEVVPPAASENFRKINFEEQVALRQKYTQGEAYFLHVGPLQPSQNLENILRAFDIFKAKTGSEVKLVLLGSKSRMAGSITKAYKQMQFKAEVIFINQVSSGELIDFYGAAVATLCVPLLAGFEMPVIEAQQCGCPVISSNTGSMPEVTGNGAMFVNPQAIEEITEALIELYHNLEMRTRLVQEGHGNVERFSWDESAEKIMRVLEEVVNPKVKSRAHL